jgi:orotate phosphoribosyltransferase
VPQTLTAPTLFAQLGDPWRLAGLLTLPEVLCDGHFRLVSGLHSDRFVRFSTLAKDPEALDYLADLLADAVARWQPDAVLAPSTAGVALGLELARRLGVRLHLTEVDGSGRPSRLIGEPPAAGTRVLAVNDVITTGEGMRALGTIATQADALPIGCCAFLARTSADVAESVGMPAAIIGSVDLSAWTADDCPLCSDENNPEDARDLN